MPRGSGSSIGESLQPGKPTSELIILSAARDLAVRKLRGFAASIGASARLVGSWSDLMAPARAGSRQSETGPKHPTLVLWDCATVALSPRDVQMLGSSYHLVAAGEPSKLATLMGTKPLTEDTAGEQSPVRMTLACSWPLSRLFDTQIARVVLSQALAGHGSFGAFDLLRWGHYSSAWPATELSTKDAASATLSGVAASFGKSISAPKDLKNKLIGVARMFDLQAAKSKAHPLTLVFASDGLLTCAIADCEADLRDKLDLAPQALKKLGCQAVMLSEHGDSLWQIAFIFGHNTSWGTSEESGETPLSMPMVVTFPQRDDDPEADANPLVSAAS